MTFWIIAGAMAASVAVLLALAMWKSGRPDRAAGARDADMQVYRDQLKEVDRDLARGILTEAEAEQVRIEVSRRLLEADRKAQAQGEDGATGAAGSRLVGAAVIVAVMAGSVLLYQQLGAPGYPDRPLAVRIAEADAARANRPDQATAEAEAARLGPATPPADPRRAELVEQLRAVMAERPDDLRGLELLAQNEAALGNFAAAYAAQERIIALKGDEVTGGDYATLADLMILAAGGFVSPQAEAVLAEALTRDPGNGTALYYSGLLYAQTRRADRAFDIWRPLLERSTPDDPWYLPIQAQIGQLAQLAGVRYTPPLPPTAPESGLRGPTENDIAAATEMSAEDRMAMIEGMVANLSDRLATEGGTAEEWARLIQALGVLGRTDEARAIADEARTAFADEPDALPVIEEARRRAGIGE